MLSHFGETRTAFERDHAFVAPDGQVPTPLPAWRDAAPVVLISPQMGARFSHYLVAADGGAIGGSPLPGIERFVFVLEGEADLEAEGDRQTLDRYSYAFVPADLPHRVHLAAGCRLTVFERRFVPLAGAEAPGLVVGNEAALRGDPFLGDEALTVRKLLPDTEAFDMAVNTMTFEPGTPLPFVETHVMEHGLLMLEGGGIYRLNERWYPIGEGDVVWMGPYCPQWFGALGKEPAKYLLYKENRRDPIAHFGGS